MFRTLMRQNAKLRVVSYETSSSCASSQVRISEFKIIQIYTNQRHSFQSVYCILKTLYAF